MQGEVHGWVSYHVIDDIIVSSLSEITRNAKTWYAILGGASVGVVIVYMPFMNGELIPLKSLIICRLIASPSCIFHLE